MASLNILQTKPITRTSKSECTTFRFDYETLKGLREEAKQKDVSTNTLLNQIVKEHLKWHMTTSNIANIYCNNR
jgi:hypothetical protein